jgi:hypothetical protein
MKRLVLTLFMIMTTASAAHAQDLAMAASMVATEHSILGGLVKIFSWADPAKGTKSEIVVKDAEGKTVHILVTSITTIWYGDNKAIMPDKIAAHSRVNVIFLSTDEGLNIGKSIKVLK